MESEGLENIVSEGSSDTTPGYFSGTCIQLHKEVDRGWRRFWKKRGFDTPPDLYSNMDMWFGRAEKLSYHEKVALKEGQQKKAERDAGIQKADREFFRKQQSLREVWEEA